MLLPASANPAVDAATSDRAWFQAMLDVEAALARVCARVGLVPPDAAAAIEDACSADRFDLADIVAQASLTATPVVPLVRALTDLVPEHARAWVHLGATSQDVLDTAAVLVARRALAPLLADLEAVADTLAVLAHTHRATLSVGRTLLQPALPTTFGAVCAGWLDAVDAATAALRDLAAAGLPVQLGGAVGTLAAYGERGFDVVDAFADELGRPAPLVPWHTDRAPLLALGAALGRAGAALATVAMNVALLSQPEIGELAEGEGGGGSSAMPHKQNAARAVLVLTAAGQVPALVGSLYANAAQEGQRGAGGWQAQLATLTPLLRLTGAAATHARAMLTYLRVDPLRMRANLETTGGVLLAERVAARLSGSLGRTGAADVVERATRSADGFRAALLSDAAVAALLSGDEIDALIEPSTYLGVAGALVDRALHARRSRTNSPGAW